MCSVNNCRVSTSSCWQLEIIYCSNYRNSVRLGAHQFIASSLLLPNLHRLSSKCTLISSDSLNSYCSKTSLFKRYHHASKQILGIRHNIKLSIHHVMVVIMLMMMVWIYFKKKYRCWGRLLIIGVLLLKGIML